LRSAAPRGAVAAVEGPDDGAVGGADACNCEHASSVWWRVGRQGGAGGDPSAVTSATAVRAGVSSTVRLLAAWGLAGPIRRRDLDEIVLVEGTLDDVRELINGTELVRLWD
jgi:hypothetical protein